MIATSLPLHKAFPSSNLLGLDILRLMTAYNDISWVRRWILDMKESPSDPIGRELFLSKMGFLVRLMMAFVHEGFAVLDQMEKLEEFEGLEHKVDQEGKKALLHLREVRSSLDRKIPLFVARIRNKVAFHYVRSEFKDALKEIKSRFGETAPARVFLPEPERGEVAYFPVADHVRDIITSQNISSEELGAIIKEFMDIEQSLSVFASAAFLAFIKPNLAP